MCSESISEILTSKKEGSLKTQNLKYGEQDRGI